MTHTPSQMPELKPCPFCGGEKFKEDWDGVTTIYGVDHQTCELICENCNVSFWIPCTNHIDDNTREDMTTKWNTRPAPDQSETIKALVGALKNIAKIGNKDGIHRWHEEAKGDFIHGGGDQIVHKADYYVNAIHVLNMVEVAVQALALAKQAKE